MLCVLCVLCGYSIPNACDLHPARLDRTHQPTSRREKPFVFFVRFVATLNLFVAFFDCSNNSRHRFLTRKFVSRLYRTHRNPAE